MTVRFRLVRSGNRQRRHLLRGNHPSQDRHISIRCFYRTVITRAALELQNSYLIDSNTVICIRK